MPSQRPSCAVILGTLLVAWAVPAMANPGAQTAASQRAAQPSLGGETALLSAVAGGLSERRACEPQQNDFRTIPDIEASWRLAVRCWELGHMHGSARNQDVGGQEGAQPRTKSNSPGHIFWIIPAFKVEYGKNVPPLTARGKFDEWARAAYDPLGLAAGGTEAALEHSRRDGFCGYGPGAAGYGKCFGSALLDANVSSFTGDFLFPVLFHQDPRYFALGKGSAGGRIAYAISRVFITRTDSGGTTIDSAALLGTVFAAALSNLYYPQQDRGFGLTMSRIAWDLGDTAAFNVAAEFWPAIHRQIKRVF